MPKPTVVLPCFLALAAPSPAAATPATRPATDAAAVTRFPTFGTAFAPPAGWTEIPREKAGRVGQWIGPDSRPTGIKSLILLVWHARAGSPCHFRAGSNL